MAEDFKDRVKIYYDAEFTGLHRGTTLISIGMVSQSGAYFYGEFNDYDNNQVDDWLRENVIANLMWKDQLTFNSMKEFWKGGLGNHPMASGAMRHINVMIKGSSEQICSDLLAWLKFESEAYGNAKLQFYTDCYAYDWMTLMDLICEGGKALNVPPFIDYIPIDLSTALLMNSEDPDISREEYAGTHVVEKLKEQYPFNELGERAKHNSLWDASVACWCFHRVLNPSKNR